MVADDQNAGSVVMTRSEILASLRSQGCSVGGFRTALRGLAQMAAIETIEGMSDAELAPEGEEPVTLKEVTDSIFSEWFGDCLPAAWRIDHSTERPTVHIYEIEMSRPIDPKRLGAWGWMADCCGYDGPDLTLHVIGHHGREVATADNNLLMCLSAFSYSEQRGEYEEGLLADLYGQAQTRLPVAPAPQIESRRGEERAILRAVYELGLIKPGEL